MTASAPDRAAIERHMAEAARLLSAIWQCCGSHDHPHRDFVTMVAKSMAAAVAGARAAAIEECAQIAEHKYIQYAGDIRVGLAREIRALAPPAQSPSSKIIAGLQEAAAHAKGETPARYDCGHWHDTFAEAQACPRAPAQSET